VMHALWNLAPSCRGMLRRATLTQAPPTEAAMRPLLGVGTLLP